MDNLFNTLNKNTTTSALELKDLFGTIELAAISGECVIECGNLIQNRAYYIAHSTTNSPNPDAKSPAIKLCRSMKS